MTKQKTEKKVIVRRNGVVVDVLPMVRETKTKVVAGRNGREQYEVMKPYDFEWREGRRVRVYKEFVYPTARQITTAERELAKTRAAAKERHDRIAAQEAAEKADPRYALRRRFSGGADFEPWNQLTLEELQTIAAIFDSKPKGDQ